MAPRFVALLVAASLTTGWLLASLLSPPVADLQGLPDRTRPRLDAREATVDAPYTEQLHLKLQQAPLAPVPRRNPFVFGTHVRTTPVGETPRAAAAESPVMPIAPAPAPGVAGPSLRLAGIGANETPAGLVRTAILSDGTTVHLVKVGQSVGGYSVVDVADDAVTIADAAGAHWLLRLK